MRLRAVLLLGLALVLASGCLSTPSLLGKKDPSHEGRKQGTDCVPLDEATQSADGESMGYYVYEAHLWHESNSLSGLQTKASCAGPADTDVS